MILVKAIHANDTTAAVNSILEDMNYYVVDYLMKPIRCRDFSCCSKRRSLINDGSKNKPKFRIEIIFVKTEARKGLKITMADIDLLKHENYVVFIGHKRL